VPKQVLELILSQLLVFCEVVTGVPLLLVAPRAFAIQLEIHMIEDDREEEEEGRHMILKLFVLLEEVAVLFEVE